jgi:hypothetical protein
VLAFDGFERSTLGANWTQLTAGGARDCIIVNASDLTASNAGGGDGTCLYNAVALPQTATYACGQLSGSASGAAGVCLAMNSTSGGSGVCCIAKGSGWEMSSYTNGGPRTLVESATSPTFALGNYIGIQRDATSMFRCYRSLDGMTWTAIGNPRTLTNFPDPGQAGAMSKGGTSLALEVWETGINALPTAVACGAH